MFVGKLSRLYKQRLLPATKYDPIGPLAIEEIIIKLNLQEVLPMIQPFNRWYIQIGTQYDHNIFDTSFVHLPQRGDMPEAARRRILQANPWSSRAINYSQELGYPPAMNGTLLMPPKLRGGGYEEELRFIIPIGFRCAR